MNKLTAGEQMIKYVEKRGESEFKMMSVYDYFANIKAISGVTKLTKLFTFEAKDGQLIYFPISLCFKPLSFEHGLKN